ncbi:sodium-dependent bicarbonate transport family permease [Dolichospermum circinale]|uniref:sodium-dependent bicarbonate transport family permease n=1 Tax=Dolichospermum circinale TaxID=109265 RepID=UPI00232C9F01|nr:sodium-dependent bicarbonate transport family permease [Dolichospermum circinale]MDB9454139.1 sodium-dependent bicarbonate transport family permease [Dolichospermum circinale CS-541/06]MDB9464657.1 sodium-dependent bicarbonate transport family permease [Dolichospermum circinale CS-541/04]MDB9549605.1 sodium-dependent bicarbonate transport family permease [Dolichospermum circinale CS-1031]
MDGSLILFNILNPPVLFFFMGMLAVFWKSDLEIPQPLPKLFSLYLLLSIGFKGGHELADSGINLQIALTLIAAIVMASIVPVYTFFILKLKLDNYNAAAIAATYGSISAVTFITASSFLEKLHISYGGHMVAALALMESPAIIVGLILVRVFAPKTEDEKEFSWGKVMHEAFLNGSVFLLVGSLIVGLLTGDKGWEKLQPFTQGIFYGVLTFFLLDMGLIAAKRIKDLSKTGSFLIGFSVFIPIINAIIGILISKVLGMGEGNGLLFAVLCASASYIAVPAAMRLTVPEANPSLYVSMALALTFPFNIIVGIPLYLQIIKLVGV